ncbi:MAG: heme-binding protein, partial [Haloarculaceae archaeon]
PPPTEEGWYALHDFRRVDWDAWRDTPHRERERALSEAVAHLESTLAVEDAAEGASALYSVLGHEADFLVLHLRPSTADIGALERRFETTEFARFTDRTSSFVSVTEASGYSERARGYFEGDLDEDSGLARYIQSRLEPTIPDATHVCFYPMDKRRDPDQNWYDLPFEERADHMAAHGEVGRDYGGRVTQMITGAIAIDDWEWGVTLWGEDLTDMKDLLYEMRFDPSTSLYAEFGPFSVGRRFPPADLPALLAGERVPTDGGAEQPSGTAGDGPEETAPVHPADAGTTTDANAEAVPDASAEADAERVSDANVDADGETVPDASAEADANAEADVETADTDEGDTSTAETETGEPAGASAGGPPVEVDGGDSGLETVDGGTIISRLATLGLEAGDDYGEGDYGVVLYSGADAKELAEEVDGLRGNFEHYDSHVTTVVRAEGGRSAVVSVWETERAADTASGFLMDLSGVEEGIQGPLGESDGSDSDSGSGGGDEAESSPEPAGSDGGATSIREELADMDVYAGKPHGEDIYALVLYSQADQDRLETEVSDLRDGFDRYDTHEGTHVYEDPDSGTLAVVSLWATEEAADTASGYLTDLPGVVGWAGEGEGFGTMGMFYTVEPEHREDFVEKFETVGGLLEGMDGHRETALLANVDDENDMFIASQWDAREDAMAFFRSEEFSETVDWGRDVLADRPRHVFLA